MRSFRFPVWMIAVMVTVLVSVIVAIEKARVLSIQLSSAGSEVHAGWWAIPGVAVATMALTGVIAVAGVGVWRLLRRV